MKKLSGIALGVSLFITTAYGATPGAVQWSFNIQDQVVGAPAVAPDGTVYAPSASQFLWAINPTGTKKWAAYTQYPITGSPAVAADGSIFLSTNTATQNLLYKLSSTGAVVWAAQTQNPPKPPSCLIGPVYFRLISAPVIVDNTTLAITVWTENEWYGSNLTGCSYSQGPTGNIGLTEAIDYVDSNMGAQLFVGAGLVSRLIPDGSPYPHTIPLSLLRKPYVESGTPITATTRNRVDVNWNLSFPGLIIGNRVTGAAYWPFIPAGDTSKLTSPVSGGNGILYVGDTKGNLFKYDETGNLLATLHLHGDLTAAAPVMASNGITYVGSSDGYIYAVDPDGTWDWATFVDSGGISQPVAINPTTGTLYVTAATGHVYALDAQGDLLWSQDGVYATTAPTLGPDGTVYVGTASNSIVAING